MTNFNKIFNIEFEKNKRLGLASDEEGLLDTKKHEIVDYPSIPIGYGNLMDKTEYNENFLNENPNLNYKNIEKDTLDNNTIKVDIPTNEYVEIDFVNNKNSKNKKEDHDFYSTSINEKTVFSDKKREEYVDIETENHQTNKEIFEKNELILYERRDNYLGNFSNNCLDFGVSKIIKENPNLIEEFPNKIDKDEAKKMANRGFNFDLGFENDNLSGYDYYKAFCDKDKNKNKNKKKSKINSKDTEKTEDNHEFTDIKDDIDKYYDSLYGNNDDYNDSDSYSDV